MLADGCDNFAPDRKEAGRLLEGCPELRDLVRGNRAFLGRAVTWAARQGIAQFLDLGAGLLVDGHPGVHESAAAVIPDARVAYVDNDPMVVNHVEARLTFGEALQAAAACKVVRTAEADVTDVSAVLGHEAVKTAIDPAKPVCVVLGLVLAVMPAAQAREIVAEYAARTAPGSLLVVSCAVFDAATWKTLRSASTTATPFPRNHTQRQIAGFLAGLELVPPGLVAAEGWRGGWQDATRPGGGACIVAGVARKP